MFSFGAGVDECPFQDPSVPPVRRGKTDASLRGSDHGEHGGTERTSAEINGGNRMKFEADSGQTQFRPSEEAEEMNGASPCRPT